MRPFQVQPISFINWYHYILKERIQRLHLQTSGNSETQTNHKQNANPDMNCANCNAKNVLKGLVKIFDNNRTIMLLCDNKFILNIRAPGHSLVVFPKKKQDRQQRTSTFQQQIMMQLSSQTQFLPLNLALLFKIISIQTVFTQEMPTFEVNTVQFFLLLLLGK